MIVVDTNVLSESTKPAGSLVVAEWLDKQPRKILFIASTTFAEVLAGLAVMPQGRWRSDLEMLMEAELDRLFEGRILAFDEAAARRYGVIAGRARAAGIAISIADAQIAAVAEEHGMAIATRDVNPFRGVGLRVINPWLEN